MHFLISKYTTFPQNVKRVSQCRLGASRDKRGSGVSPFAHAHSFGRFAPYGTTGLHTLVLLLKLTDCTRSRFAAVIDV
ncbi:MAG: hypothetical protein IJ158_10260 [Treponema sp.]|nr:hypothetical protein [Treponema sp.]